MRNIYKHLNTNIILLILIIYTVFLFSFFIMSSNSEYQNAKIKLEQRNNYQENILQDRIDHVNFYNDQINDILNFNHQYSYYIDEQDKFLMSTLLKHNHNFSNFLIINQLKEIDFSFQDISIDNINYSILNKVNNENNMILTNKFDPGHLTVIYQYNNNQYFIYYISQSEINAFVLEDENNELISDSQIKLPKLTKNTAYSHLLEGSNLNYYKKITLFNHNYYLITQVPKGTLIHDLWESSIIPVGLSLIILGLLIYLSHLKIIQIVKKPYNNFIQEVEDLEEKDFSYINSINEAKTGYWEFYRILNEFKKICLYNKNKYANIIQEMKDDLTSAQEENKAKSLFLANMSHEMRTPLNSIIGYTQLTEKVGFDNRKKVQEYFNSIHNSSEILLQKINDILDISKIQSKQFELQDKPTEFKQVIKEMYDVLGIQAEKKNIDFSYYVDPQVPKYLDFDSTRLKQILINLCSNAIKFTDNGSVRLEIEVFGYTKDSVYLEYIITDTGIGIPKDKIDNIFVPFVQVDNNNNMQMGTGLGLTIARDLIRLMGGDINVTSKEHVGSIFNFITKFKISSQEIKLEDNVLDIENEIFINTIKDKRILICEDNLINQIFMKEIFSVFNKKDIEIASDGYEAVEKCKNKTFDLILMDIQMPNMNGIEATKIIKSFITYQNVPIIALTANAFSEQINEYLLSGMNDYLPKPVDIKRFKYVLVKNL